MKTINQGRGTESTGCQWGCVLNRKVRKGLTEKLAFGQRFEAFGVQGTASTAAERRGTLDKSHRRAEVPVGRKVGV